MLEKQAKNQPQGVARSRAVSPKRMQEFKQWEATACSPLPLGGMGNELKALVHFGCPGFSSETAVSLLKVISGDRVNMWKGSFNL